MTIIWRVSSYLFRYRGMFALTILLAVLSTIFLILVPKLVGYIIDTMVVEGEGSLGQLGLGAGFILLCYLGREVFNSLRIRVNNTLEQKVLIDLRKDLHDKLLDLPVSFYDKRKSGDIASRVIDDVNNVERALLDGTEQGVTAILTILGITAILFSSQPVLAAFVFLPVPVLIWMARQHAKVTRKLWRQVRDSSGDLNSLLVEDIQGNRLIHAFALKDHEKERFHKQAVDLKDKTLKAMYRWSIFGPGTSFVSSLGLVAVVGVGGYLLSTSDTFTYGDFTQFLLYCGMIYEPISRLGQLTHLFSTGKASGERVFEIVDHPVEITNVESPKEFPTGIPSVTYENVEFAYSERSSVLEKLNLTLPAGKMTALVGHTGAGKSTIANLLLRYYDATSGNVRINGIDVREIELGKLRSSIGVVSQDPFLFDASVRQNLALVKRDAEDEEIIEALKGAKAWDFVQRLPDGLDTNIGERGIRLSMGEKQRLTIARVLLKNPPLVILDEATSSVDTITERQIQEALVSLMENRTLLVIAHRLSTIRMADQIVVLERGNVIEKGNHETLLKMGGHYADLWNTQNNYLVEEWCET